MEFWFNKKNNIALWIWMIALALFNHFLYGSLGFNPTDEGFILAQSRRIIEGQVPHVDFISIRPVLSAILHIPEVLFGADYVFYISRFITRLQFAVISVLWTLILFKSHKKGNEVLYFATATFIYIFNTYYFPLMAWHTIDGLFLATTGFYLILKNNKLTVAAGYFLLGAAVLTKQNFALIPFIVWLLYHFRKFTVAIVFIILPSLFYVLWIGMYNGLPQLLQQLQSETSIVNTGISAYILNPFFIITIITLFIILIILKSKQIRISSHLFQSALAVIILLLAVALAIGKYENKPVFFITGLAVAVLAASLINNKLNAENKILAVIIFTGWSASVSVGLNSPVLFSGVILIAVFLNAADLFNIRFSFGRKENSIFLLLFIITIAAYHFANRNYIYRDLPAKYLNFHLKDVLPGATFIYTNQQTGELMQELSDIANNNGKRKVVILTEFAAFWVRHSHINPLQQDWTSGLEIANPVIRESIVQSIIHLNDDTDIIIQRYQSEGIAIKKLPVNFAPEKYSIPLELQDVLDHKKQYRFFDVYILPQWER